MKREEVLPTLDLTSIATAASQDESLSGPDQKAWKQLNSALDGTSSFFEPAQSEQEHESVRERVTFAIKEAITGIPETAWTANLAQTLVKELADSHLTLLYRNEEILIHTLTQMPSEIMIKIHLELMEIMIDQDKVSAVETLINRADLRDLDWNDYNTDQAPRQMTPLTHAIKRNTPHSRKIARILIEHGGVDLNRTFDDYESCVGGYANGVNPPLEYCVINGNLETLQLLIKKGATQGLTDLVTRVINAPESYPYPSDGQNQMAVLKYLKERGSSMKASESGMGGAAPAAGGDSPVRETEGLMGGGGASSSPSLPPMQLEGSAEIHSGRGMGGVFVGVVTLVAAALGVLAGVGIGLGATGSNITGLATLGTFLGGAGLPYVLVGGIIFGVLGLVGARMAGRARSGDDARADTSAYVPLVDLGHSPAEVRSATQPLVSPSSPQVAAPSGQRERAEGSLSPRASQSPTPGGGESK